MLTSIFYVVLTLAFFVTVALDARPRPEGLPVRAVLRAGVLRLALQGVCRFTEIAGRGRPGAPEESRRNCARA